MPLYDSNHAIGVVGPLSFSQFYTPPHPADTWTPPFPVDPTYSLSLTSQTEEALPSSTETPQPTIVVTTVGESLPPSPAVFSTGVPSPRVTRSKPPLQIAIQSIRNASEGSPSSSERTSGTRTSSLPPLDQASDSDEGPVFSPALPHPLSSAATYPPQPKSNPESLLLDHAFSALDLWPDLVPFELAPSGGIDAHYFPPSQFVEPDHALYPSYGAFGTEPARPRVDVSMGPSFAIPSFASTASLSPTPSLELFGMTDYVHPPRERKTVYMPHPLQYIGREASVARSSADSSPLIRPYSIPIPSISPSLPSPSASADLLHGVLTQWQRTTLPFMYPLMRGDGQLDVNALVQAFFTPGVERDAMGTPVNGCQEAILATSSQ